MAPRLRFRSLTCGCRRRCVKRAISAGWQKSAASKIDSPRIDVLNPQDLQRLIDIITEEVIAAQGTAKAGVSRCTCHSVLLDCCPDRLRGVIDAGATRLGVHATGGAAGGVSAMIDHT